MGTKIAGFTIIETLLFLAISGLMMVAMIAGVSVNLNTQRYNDSVRTFHTLIQEQYAKIASTENDRPADRPCGLDATASPQENPSQPQIRGQSKCEVIGRYMAVEGSNIAIYPVLAYRNATIDTATTDDIALMRNASYMRLGIDSSLADTRLLEWGTEIAWPSTGSEARSQRTPRSLALLFIRSPDSGQMYTFSSDSAPLSADSINENTIRSMIVAGNTTPGQAARTICVDSAGLVLSSTLSIFVNGFATSSTGIEMRTNDYFKQLGTDIQC